MKTLKILLLTVFIPFLSYAQNDTTQPSLKERDSINFILGFRVNFKTRPDQKRIFNLFKDYVYSNIDSLSGNNPYWTNQKIKEYPNYDMSLTSIYGSTDFVTPQFIKKNVDIYVLSIEQLNDSLYTISAQYQIKGGLRGGISILCTRRLSAVKVNGMWKLQNNIVHYTRNWETFKTKNITYRYSCKDNFSTKKASKANRYYDSLLTIYNLTPSVQHIYYYFAKSKQELGELRGFDYFGLGITTGITDSKNGFITSCKSPFHAHELVHFAFGTDSIERNFLIEEGCAEFLGSRIQYPKKYNQEMSKLATDIENDSTYTIKNLITMNPNVSWNGYNYRYYFGAILCKMVYDKTGVVGLKKLMFSNTKVPEKLIKTLDEVLEVKSKRILFKRIKQYVQIYK